MALRFTTVLIVACAGIGLLFLALAGAAPPSVAQTPQPFQPVVGSDIQHDVSPPLSELSRQSQHLNAPQTPHAINAVNRMLPKARLDPKFLQALIDRGLDPMRYLLALAPTDPVVQNNIDPLGALNAMPPALENFEGVNNVDAVLPPDTNGDIGYDPATNKKYYMQWVNLSYAIWDVSNTPTQIVPPTNGNALWSGFGGPCETNNDGDPIVLFDQLAQRWLASQFALPNYGFGPYYQCIAISQTANPTGAWYRYAVLVSATKMNDYPKFGVWPDGYYMTVNQFIGGYSWGGAGVFVFDRARMLSGLSATFVYFDLYSVSPDFGGMLPSDWDGDTPPPPGAPNYFLEVDDNLGTPNLGADAMRIWKFQVNWTTPAN